jgi:hypothetical protein
MTALVCVYADLYLIPPVCCIVLKCTQNRENYVVFLQADHNTDFRHKGDGMYWFGFGTLPIDFPRCVGRLLAIKTEDLWLPRTITRLPHRMLQGQYHLSRICYMIFLGT